MIRNTPKPSKVEEEITKALGVPDEANSDHGDAKMLRILENEDENSLFIIFTTDHGVTTELRFEGEEPLFTQRQLAEIFGVDTDTVSDHIKVFQTTGELSDATTGKFPVVQKEGNRSVRREIKHYSLDVAFYVGYRVNSTQGALFRRWATDVLIQVATKNYYIDKQKLKDPDQPSIIDELRDEIREIRTATANVYREVRRICTLCQDYDPRSQQAQHFYANMENKLLWAATSHTAAELVLTRADADKPNMGLTFYTGKKGPIQKDVTVGNNYLAETEAKVKNRATEMLLTYFEDQLDQGRLATMAEVESKLIEFIKFNNWPLLTDLGRAKKSTADQHALEQLKIYKRNLQ